MVGAASSIMGTPEWGGVIYGGKNLAESLKGLLNNEGTSTTDTESIPTMAGCRNTSGLGKVVPLILGKTKYTPSFIGNPFHTISGADGETETFHALYNLGYKDVQVKNVSLDIYDVANNDELVESGNLSINPDSIYNENDYKTKIVLDNTGGYYDFNGQLQWNDGYQQRVVEEDRNVELICEETDLDGNTKSLAVPFFSEKYPHRMEVEIQFNGLLQYNDEGEEEETEVELEIKMSKDGGSTYQSIRNGGFFVNTNTDGNVKFETSTTSTSNITKIKGKKNKVLRYVCPMSFTWEDVKDVKNNRLEFIIQRKNYTPKEKNARNQVYLKRVRTWCYNRKESLAQNKMIVQFPITEKLKKKIKTLSFSISTGKQEAYNVLDKLNVELTSKARIWNSTTKEWSTDYHPTNNIASIVLMLLQHDCRGKKIVSDERIDLESFGRFYEFCEKKKLYCNGAVSKESKTIDILNELLVIGRGIFVLNGNKYAIAIDDVQENPVMVLNSQNILSISHSKVFEEKIDGYQATFVNALNDYQEDEIIVADADLSDENTTLERVTVNYVTDPAQVQKYLYYKLANRRLRNEKSQIRLSVDGYLIEVGNLVLVQEESLSVGIGQGAEIKRVVTDGEYITGVYVDANFNTTDTSKEYGIEVNITLPDNYNGDRVVTYKLKNLNVISNYLEFDTPIHLDSVVYPQVGDIISFGIYGNIATKRLCVSKKENGDGTFDLDFIPYQEGVYTADEGEIPEFISNVSSVKETSSASLSSVVPTVTLEELNKRLETVNQTIEDALADIGVDTRIDDITSADAVLEEHQIQIKLNIDYDNFIGNIKDFIYELSTDNGTTWNEIKRVNSDIYNYPLPSIHRYKEKDYFANWKLRVKAQSQYDTYSENWYEFDIDTSNYGTWIPPKFEYDQVIAIANEQGININLNNKFPSDVKLYGSYNTIVEFSRDGENWIEVKDNYIPFDRSIDGYPEKEQVEQYRIRVHRKSYLVDHPLMYTEKYVDATDYGTWVPPVFAVNQIDAIAMEQGISVSLDNRLPNNTKYYGSYSTIIEYTRDGISWNVADGEFIYFDRDVDGYPEKSQLENYKVRVTRKSLVIDHELIYTEQYIDTSSYSTWLPLAPTLRTSISGRTININIEQRVRDDGLRPYGVIKYKVQVKRITPIEDDKYSCPSLSLNPYDSEDNYKDDNSDKDYVLVDNNHRQTMPLSGQNAPEPLPVDTMYRFKITAINLVTDVEAEPLETPNLTALATSVKDIVAGAITTTKLADNCVTVDKIAVDTLVANESFMNEITSNVVNAGKLTFEVMNVKDFGFIAGNDEPITYKYTKDDGTEGTFTPNKGELFFGDGEPADSNVVMAEREGNCIQLRTQSTSGIVPERKLYISAEDIASRNNTCKYLRILSSDDNTTSVNQVDNIYVYLFNKEAADGDETSMYIRRTGMWVDTPSIRLNTTDFEIADLIKLLKSSNGYTRLTLGNTDENFDVYIKGKLYQNGATNIDNTLTVKGATALHDTLSVSNATTLHGSLEVSGITKVNDILSVKNNIQVPNTTSKSLTSWGTEPLSIGPQTALNLGIDRTGIQARHGTNVVGIGINVLGGNVSLSKAGYNTKAYGTLEVNEATTLNSTLSVNGATTLRDILSVAKNIQIPSSTDTSLTSWGTEPLSIGTKTGVNIGIDTNEIQARNNTTASILYLNADGGNVEIGNALSTTTINGSLLATANKAINDSKGNAITSYTKSPSLATNIVTTQSGATAIPNQTSTYKHLNLLLKKTDGNSTTTNMSDVNILQSAYSSNSGYVKFANGLIIQWGNKTVDTRGGYTCPYNIDFTTSNIFVSAMANDGVDVGETMNVYNITNSKFIVNRKNVATSNWKWFAIGY